MSDAPLVSVMMAAYNAERYIGDAIASILDQTYVNWELIVLNDGSTDATRNIVGKFRDPRIHYSENAQNMGLVYTRNKMIVSSVGHYLAVLDSDDIAYPTRLEAQVKFLEKNPDFGVVGTGIDMIDEHGKFTGTSVLYDEPPDRIPVILLFSNYFAHSTIMMRRSALPLAPYRLSYPPAEDYDLWVRISQSWRMINLPRVLGAYRVHGTNTSSVLSGAQRIAERKILANNVRTILVMPFSEEKIDLLHRLLHPIPSDSFTNEQYICIRDSLISIWRDSKYRAGDVLRWHLGIELLRLFFLLLNAMGFSSIGKMKGLCQIEIGGLPLKIGFVLLKIRSRIRGMFISARASFRPGIVNN